MLAGLEVALFFSLIVSPGGTNPFPLLNTAGWKHRRNSELRLSMYAIKPENYTLWHIFESNRHVTLLDLAQVYSAHS